MRDLCVSGMSQAVIEPTRQAGKAVKTKELFSPSGTERGALQGPKEDPEGNWGPELMGGGRVRGILWVLQRGRRRVS